MKPIEIEFLLRDRTDEGLDRMSGNLDGVQAKYNSTRATIETLRKEMEKLQWQKLSPGVDASGNTAQIDALKKKITELRTEVAALEKEYPELGKTVSGTPLTPPDAQTVKSTYNGLHNSIQQIAREMPALAMGPQTFFLAISNNLPIFTDELARARKEYDELIKKGQKGVPVWKQVLSSLFSWQTALTTGIMLLTMYGGKVAEWIGNMQKGKDAAIDSVEAIEKMNDAMDTKGTADQIAGFQKLALAYRKLGDDAEAKKEFIEKYRDEIDKTGISVRNVTDADNLFITNSAAFIESVKQRALALAGVKLASEQYEKALKTEDRDRTELMAHESRLEMLKAKPGDYKESVTVQSSSMGGFSSTVQTRDELIAEEEKMIEMIKGRAQAYKDAGDAYIDLANAKKSAAKQTMEDAGLTPLNDGNDDNEGGYSEPDKRDSMTKQLARMEADAQVEVSEMTVRAMKEGYERERKEAELEFEQKKARIQQELEERLALYAELRKAGATVQVGAEERTKALAATQTAKAGMVYSNRLAQIDAQEMSDEEERLQKTEAELQELLGKYRDYEAQRAAIKEQGDNDIAALEAARTETNSEEIDRAIEVARQKVQEGIRKVNDAEAASTMEDSGFIRKLFGDWSSMPFESLKELMSQARMLKDYLSGNSDSTGITFISKEQLETIENSPEQLDRLKKALDRLLDGKSGGSNKWSIIFKDFEKGLEDLKDAEGLEAISGAIGKIAGTAGDAAGELSGLFKAFGMDEASEIAGGIQQMLSAVSNIGEGFAKGGVIGAAGAALGEFINFAKSAIEAENRRYEAVKEIQSAKLDFQRQYNILLLEQNLLLEEASNIFGERQIAQAANAMNVYRQALDELNASMQYGFDSGSRASSGTGVRSSRGTGKTTYDAKEQYDQYAGGLGKAMIVTGFEKTGLFGWGKGRDVYSSVLDVYPELIDESGKLDTAMLQTILDTREMSDETRSYLENLLDLNDTLEDAKETLRGYLQETYGGLGDGLLDSVVASISSGEDALAGFADNIGSTFENLGEQLAYSLYFADEFDRLQKDLEELYGSGKSEKDITEDAMDLLDRFYDGISDDASNAQAWLQAWQKKAAEKGFDIWDDGNASQNGKSAAFTTITQDQGTKLEGLFTSGQIHWANMDENIEDMGSDIYDGLSHLKNIDNSTSEMRQELLLIRQDISSMKRDGIKVK